MKAFIKNIAYSLPEKVLTNEEIVSLFPEWTTEKIDSKIGIKERHVTNDSETALDIGIAAAKKLFFDYSINKDDIDYLIFCTQSADYYLPTSACIMQTKLGLSKSIGAIDINLGCSGWIYCLSVAKALVISEMASNVLVVTSETYSKYINPKDKGNRTIFGDGAAATLVSTEGIGEIGHFVVGTDGKGANNLIVKTGGARHRNMENDSLVDDFGNPESSDYLYMNGPDILNYTLDVIPGLVYDVLEKNAMTIDDIDLHIYHQANMYISKLQRRKLKIPIEKYYEYYEKVGNTVSSTIPIAIREALNDGSIKKGYNILSVAQGLGYSWGGVVLKF